MVHTKWLNLNELEPILEIRKKVFAEEQNLLLPDTEDIDSHSLHLAIYDSGTICGCGRITKTGENCYLIGRIAVLPNKRGNGYGDLIVRMLVRKAFSGGDCQVLVEANTEAVNFYRKLDFKPVGNQYLKDGVRHIKMIRNTDVSGNCR